MPPGTNISSYYITAVFTTSDEGNAWLGVVEVHTLVYLAVCSLCIKHNMAHAFQIITGFLHKKFKDKIFKQFKVNIITSKCLKIGAFKNYG